MTSLRIRLLLLAVGTFALGTDGYVIAGLLPAVGRDLGVSAATAGQLITVFALLFAAAALIGGVLTAQLPRKIVVVNSMAVFTAANVLGAAAPTFAVMMVARVFAAMSAAVFMPAASGVAASLAPPETRGRALAVVMGGMTAATALGVPLGTLVGALAGWRATFALVAGLGAVAAAGIALFMPGLPAIPAASLRERVRVARRAGVPGTLALTGVWIAGAFTVYTYLATILDHVARVHGSTLSLWFLVFGVAAMAGNMLGGRFTDRGHGATVLIAGVACLGTGVLVLAGLAQAGIHGTAGALAAAIALAVWGVGGWAFNPAQQHRLVGLAPDAAPVVLSLNVSVLQAGIALGGLLGGLTLDLGGVSLLTWSAAALEAVALTLVIGLTRRAGGTRQPARSGRTSTIAPTSGARNA